MTQSRMQLKRGTLWPQSICVHVNEISAKVIQSCNKSWLRAYP